MRPNPSEVKKKQEAKRKLRQAKAANAKANRLTKRAPEEARLARQEANDVRRLERYGNAEVRSMLSEQAPQPETTVRSPRQLERAKKKSVEAKMNKLSKNLPLPKLVAKPINRKNTVAKRARKARRAAARTA